MKWLLSFFLFILVLACSETDSKVSNNSNKRIESSAPSGSFFKVVEGDSSLDLYAVNPLHPEQFEHYVVGSRSSEKGIQSAFQISSPLKKVVCLSTSHIGFLDALGVHNSLVGSRNPELIYSAELHEKYLNGDLVSVGAAELNLEKLVAMDADVVFASVYDARGMKEVEQMRHLNIPVVLISEFLEEQPLRKAEWIKFFAAFFGKEIQHKADSIFSVLEESYIKTKSKLASIEKRPEVFTGLPWGGNWYVPGGKSFQANFIKDAGAEYLFSDNLKINSFVVDFEVMLQKGIEIPYWINVSDAESRAEILEMDNRFSYFDAFEKGNIYNNNARKNTAGGNDYWESGAVRPDIVIKDLATIFYPELMKEHQLFYYQKLE